jgi:YidC/Oxa1 family membrane protein insertase
MGIFSSLFSSALGTIIGFTGDWFVAIALLTIAIKVVLMPLSLKQHRGMLLTQNFSQAKVLLDEKFKDKSERVSAELIKIMGKYRVNPLSSVLVMLVQLPVLYSFYISITHLSSTVGSAIIPWVLSVSMVDGLHILPILASAIQGLQGLLAPTGQAGNMLMIVLPIGIGLLFLWHAPAGLSVYWACSALFGLAEKKLFSLRAIRERYLVVPTVDEMVQDIA